MSGKPKLAIELVPLGNWRQNVRTICPDKVWDRLRRITYKRAHYRCQICGESGIDQGWEWPVECHEIWVFDDERKIQKLDGLIALCPLCHEVKHIGRTAKVQGQEGLQRALLRLTRVNDWTKEQVQDHLKQAFADWERRSQESYTLDISWAEPATPRASQPVYD